MNLEQSMSSVVDSHASLSQSPEEKKSTEDDRDLWPEMFRVIQTARPTWVIGENVANFLNLAFTRTKTDLESIGYVVQPFIIPACAIGAQHRRDRVWIIAHLDRPRLRIVGERSQERKAETDSICEHVSEKELTANVDGNGYQPDTSLQTRNEGTCSSDIRNGEEGPITYTDSEGVEGFGSTFGNETKHANLCGNGAQESSSDLDGNGLSGKTDATAKKNNKRIRKGYWWSETTFDFGCWWSNQSGMGRAVYGFSGRVDRFRRNRVKALGNAIVPAMATIIGKAIMESEQ